jgi:hypothetical protein
MTIYNRHLIKIKHKLCRLIENITSQNKNADISIFEICYDRAVNTSFLGGDATIVTQNKFRQYEHVKVTFFYD